MTQTVPRPAQAAADLIAVTRPIADPGELLGRLPASEPLAWVRNGEGLVGWGVAARLEVRGKERFARAQRWWSTLVEQLQVDDRVSVPGTGPVAFGSFAFDPERGTSVVIVPEVVIGRRGGQAWMTVIGVDPDPRPSLPPVIVSEAATVVRWSEGSATVFAW